MMEYYHLTPEVDPMSSDSEAEKEEDDDPNWLIVTHSKNNNFSSSSSNIKKPPSKTITTTTTTSISLETTSQKKTNKEVIRRPKQPQASANGISSYGNGDSSVPPKRRHQNRLSRIWDGVIASYYVDGGAAVSEKTTSEKTAFSSSSSSEAAASNETRMPSERSSNVDNEEDLVQRINELFNSIQQQQQEASHEDTTTSHPSLRRPKTRTGNRGGRSLRNLHTVSGYFNDWAKWLTSSSGSSSNISAEANPFPQQCNNGPDTGYRKIDIHILHLVPLAILWQTSSKKISHI